MIAIEEIPPLAERAREDELAMKILSTVAEMAEKLEPVPRGHAVEQRVGCLQKSFTPSLYTLLNAGLMARSEPGQRLTLTRAGWEFLGKKPPLWLDMGENR